MCSLVGRLILGSRCSLCDFTCGSGVLLKFDHFLHLFLQSLSLQLQTVLVPDEIGNAGVEVVTLTALLEQVDDVVVVRLSCEAKSATVRHEFLVLRRVVEAKVIEGDFLLLALDCVIFFVLGASWEALPWQGSFKEIEQDVTNGLQVVSTGLLVTDVSADGGVSSCASKILALTEGNVLTLRVLVALGETEIDNVDGVLGLLRAANHEIVWLDISMDNSLFVHFLDALDLRKLTVT